MGCIVLKNSDLLFLSFDKPFIQKIQISYTRQVYRVSCLSQGTCLPLLCSVNQYNIKMKQTIFYQQKPKTISFLKRATKLIVCTLLLSKAGLAQLDKEHAFGISASSMVTCSGFGTIYSPGVFYSSGKHLVEAAPLFQKRDAHLSGARLNYEYTVFDGARVANNEYGNENLELFFFGGVNYHCSAILSKAQIRREEMVARHKESAIVFENLKYKALESYAGFGLKRKLSKKIKWSNLIGFGGWQTLKGEKNIDREYAGPGIILKTSLLFTL